MAGHFWPRKRKDVRHGRYYRSHRCCRAVVGSDLEGMRLCYVENQPRDRAPRLAFE